MAANPAELLALNCCLASYPAKELQAMQIQLLASIASMAADPATLLALNCCLASGYSERQLQAMIVQLLQGVIDGGGGGGAGNTVGSGPPAADGTVLGQGYWDETNKNLYIWDSDGWNIH